MGPGTAPALRGPTRSLPSREIQAIEPPPVPMVLMSSIGMRTGERPPRPPLLIFGLAPSIRQRSVEVPPASSVTRSGKPAISAITALPSAPAAGPDNAVVIGLGITWAGLATPPDDWLKENGFLFISQTN